jgi:uncharacterized protein YggT (Ycf19 family)
MHGARRWRAPGPVADGAFPPHRISAHRAEQLAGGVARPTSRTAMTTDKLAADEYRQETSRDAVKSRIDSRVNAEISGEAATASPDGHAKVAEAAAQLRESSLDETMRRERTVGHARTAARGSQFLDYGFYVLYTLLAIRLVLALLGARPANGFVQFIRALTGPFYAPFRGIVSSPAGNDGATLVLPIVIAVAVYMMLHAAINGLLRMVGNRKTTI